MRHHCTCVLIDGSGKFTNDGGLVTAGSNPNISSNLSSNLSTSSNSHPNTNPPSALRSLGHIFDRHAALLSHEPSREDVLSQVSSDPGAGAGAGGGIQRAGSREETNCRLRVDSMRYDDDGGGLSPAQSGPPTSRRPADGLPTRGRANSLVGTIGMCLLVCVCCV